MPRISIGPENWIKGATSSPYSFDGGFSPELKGHNIDLIKGAIAPTDTPTKIGDFVSGYNGFIIGVSEIFSLICATNSTNDLKVHRYQAGSLGNALATEETLNYTQAISDMSYVDGNFYIAAKTDISKITSGGGDFDADWWTAVGNGDELYENYPHHFAKLGNDIYVSDYRWLHKISRTGITEDVLDINSYGDQAITTICFHDDKIYIGIEVAGYTNKGEYYLAYWDGNADQILGIKVAAPDKIYSMASYNGQLYVFTEKRMYLWNGLKFIPIRDLNGIVYKSQIVQANGVLYFVGANESTSALSAKCIQAFNGSAFWFPYDSENTIYGIGNVFGDDLVICENEDLNKIDLNDKVGSGQAGSLPIDFVSNVIIRKITVELTENMASGNVNTIKLYNQTGTLKDTLTMSYALDGAVRAKEFRDRNIENLTSLVVKLDTFNNPVRRITIDYDTTNQPF